MIILPLLFRLIPSLDGMFVILVPLCLSPLVITLLWTERKAKILGLTPTKERPSEPFLKRARKLADELDLLGLVLITACIALILLPLTMIGTVNGGWSNRQSYFASSTF